MMLGVSSIYYVTFLSHLANTKILSLLSKWSSELNIFFEILLRALRGGGVF